MITFYNKKNLHLLNQAENGINKYLNREGSHLSFFARTFDGTRGIHRAEQYKKMLLDSTVQPKQKFVALYALLATYDGKQLKKDVVEALQCNNLAEAREKVKNQFLKYTNTLNDESILNIVNNHVKNLVKYTNLKNSGDAAKTYFAEQNCFIGTGRSHRF